MNIHLISAILKSIWAIDPDAALSYAPLLNNLLGTGMKLEFSFDAKQFEPFLVPKGEAVKKASWESWDEYPEGTIAVIPLSGPLMKSDEFCGPVGMATIGKRIKQADKANNVDAIILQIDSPGGTVDGTMELEEIVAGTSKPVVAFVDGMMASAALWIGSAADEVIGNNNKAVIGSIGVICSFADMQPAYEKLGVKFHTIVADQSPDKNKMNELLREGKYEEYKKEVLNPFAAEFIAAVRKNRPGVKDDQLTGKVYFAENLTGTLIDSIGNFDYAVQRASELAAQHKKELESKTQKPVQMKKQYASVNNVLGVEQLEAQDDGVFLNEDQVASIDAALDQGSKDSAELQASKDAEKKAKDDLATAQQSIQEKDAEIAQLKKNAGAETAKVISEKETAAVHEKDENVTSDEKSFEENLEAARKAFS